MSALPSYFNKLNILKQIPIFEGLNWFELTRIARRSVIVEYNKGDMICQQSSPADAFYALVSGRVYCYALNSAGQKEEVDFILRGMHFGIISTLTGENHSHTYEAINDSVVLKIDKDEFSNLLKATPKLAVSLSQSLSKRIHSHVNHNREIQECRIISVYAPVKGSGSSTYAANLALHLKQEASKNVLLLSLSSDINEQIVDLADIISDHNRVSGHIIKDRLPIDILPVKFDSRNPAIVARISQFVSAPATSYNFIVLDLPNEMDEVVMKTLLQSDAIHLVTVDKQEHLATTRHVIDQLQANLKDKFDPNHIQVILSGVNENPDYSPAQIKETLNYDVFLQLPHLKPDEFTFEQINVGFSIVRVDEGSDYAFVIKRLARQISGVLVGVVLGGGAALGLAHVGVIRVLEREGIPVDIVVGSSMGALIGGLWAVGNKADELEKYAREFSSWKDIAKVVDPILPIAGVVGGIGIRKWVQGKLKDKTFHHTKIPIKIVAYDLYHRKELVIDDGQLVDAIHKSVAIPGVIRPIMENNQMIIDGGVLNPLPTNVLVDMGVKKIIAINVLQSPEQVVWGFYQEQEVLKQELRIPFSKHPFKYIGLRLKIFFGKAITPNMADIIVRTLQATEYILAEQSGKQADVLIHPDLKGINWYELYEVDRLIKRGEEAAMKALPAIKSLVKK